MTWEKFLEREGEKNYYKNLMEDLKIETRRIIPRKSEWFKAFEATPFEQVKVVLIDHLPYKSSKEATGLAFSVFAHTNDTLEAIYQEIEKDLGIRCRNTMNLSRWAKQGVFLFNVPLTWVWGDRYSHFRKGWDFFSINVIKELNKDNNPKVFLLLGEDAQSFESFITNPIHLVLKGAYPSSLEAKYRFFGKGFFSKINDFLVKNKRSPINWR